MSTKIKRVYSEQEKVSALTTLAACGGNVSKAARTLNIPRKSLEAWAKRISGVKSIENLPEKVEQSKMELAEKFTAIAHALCDVAPSKIKDAKLQNVMVSAAIAVDKAALLRGQPTSISETRSERARYETAIAQVVSECHTNGITISREEAITLLEPHLPGIKKHLGTYLEASRP